MAIVESFWNRFNEDMAEKVTKRIVRFFESAPYPPCRLVAGEFRDWASQLPREHDEYPREIAYGAMKAFKYLRHYRVVQFLTTA